MAPGNRVDVVLRCTEVGNFTVDGRVPGTGEGYGPPAAVLSFNVAAGTAAAQGDLTTFTAKRPQYLADVYVEADHPAAATMVQHSLNMTGTPGGCMVRFDDTEKSWDHTAHGSMELGTIQKWSLSGVDKHPWHIHINSFQLAGGARGLPSPPLLS